MSSGGAGIEDLINAFPKIVLAMMGISGVDISAFSGFYAALAQYTAILTAVYAVWLSNNAVSRESFDKTMNLSLPNHAPDL